MYKEKKQNQISCITNELKNHHTCSHIGSASHVNVETLIKTGTLIKAAHIAAQTALETKSSSDEKSDGVTVSFLLAYDSLYVNLVVNSSRKKSRISLTHSYTCALDLRHCHSTLP